MYRIEPKFLKQLFRDISNDNAGRLCKRLENLEKAGIISKKTCDLLKDDLKDISYESFRHLERNIKYHNNYKLYTPSK